jgi:hypothetical protein
MSSSPAGLTRGSIFFEEMDCRVKPGNDNYFVHVATAVVPFITDHLLSPAVMMRKQFAFEPFQVVQKPSLLSFQVPSPFAPDFATGSRVILPSAVNTILNFTFEGVDDVNGWPLKKVA